MLLAPSGRPEILRPPFCVAQWRECGERRGVGRWSPNRERPSFGRPSSRQAEKGFVRALSALSCTSGGRRLRLGRRRLHHPRRRDLSRQELAAEGLPRRGRLPRLRLGVRAAKAAAGAVAVVAAWSCLCSATRVNCSARTRRRCSRSKAATSSRGWETPPS